MKTNQTRLCINISGEVANIPLSLHMHKQTHTHKHVRSGAPHTHIGITHRHSQVLAYTSVVYPHKSHSQVFGKTMNRPSEEGPPTKTNVCSLLVIIHVCRRQFLDVSMQMGCWLV